MNPTVEGIWSEFAPYLKSFISSRLAEPQAAEDLLQDVFVKLQSDLDQLKDPAKLKGWLFLVARNAIIDYYRTRKKFSQLPESLPAELSEHETEAKELKALFHRLLQNLPEPYRQVLLLTEFEGLTQAQLAERLGISLSGAKSRVQRGRELLKERLLDHCRREFSRTVGVQPCPKGLLPLVGDGNAKGEAVCPRPNQRAEVTTAGTPLTWLFTYDINTKQNSYLGYVGCARHAQSG
jgi:RNA polymerase sigma-70 factor (ECF subfamily)